MREFGWLCRRYPGRLRRGSDVTPALLLAFGLPRARPRASPATDGVQALRAVTALGGALAGAGDRVRLLVGALAAASRVRISTDTVHAFPVDSPVRVDFDAINSSLDGATSFSVVIDAGYREAFADPAQLLELESLQRWLEQQPEVGGTRSIADWVKLLQRAASGGEPGAAELPASSSAIGGLLLVGRGDEQDERSTPRGSAQPDRARRDPRPRTAGAGRAQRARRLAPMRRGDRQAIVFQSCGRRRLRQARIALARGRVRSCRSCSSRRGRARHWLT
jgi:hypothetical protein